MWTIMVKMTAFSHLMGEIYYSETEQLSELVDEILDRFGEHIESITILR